MGDRRYTRSWWRRFLTTLDPRQKRNKKAADPGQRPGRETEDPPAPTPLPHPYRILGFPAEATSEQIRNRFRELVKTTHPDKLHDANPEQIEAATGTNFSDEEYRFHLATGETRTPEDTSYRAYLDHGVTIRHRDWFALHNEREQMRLRWADFFNRYDLLLSPIAASAAFVHDHAGERPDRTILINGRQEPAIDQLFWAGLSGVVYLPSTVAPAGLTRSGLPCGLQIIADYMEDNTALEFARLMEEALGGFQAPPGYG